MDDFEQFVRGAEAELTRALAGHLPLDEVANAVAEAMAFAWEHRAHVKQIEVATSAVTTPREAPGRQTSRAGRGASWTVRERERDRHVTPAGDDSGMNVSDVVEILPAIFNKRTVAAITGLVGTSIFIAYDATPPKLLAPLQFIGCPLAEQMNDDLIDQLHDVVVKTNQGVEVERPEAVRPPGC